MISTQAAASDIRNRAYKVISSEPGSDDIKNRTYTYNFVNAQQSPAERRKKYQILRAFDFSVGIARAARDYRMSRFSRVLRSKGFLFKHKFKFSFE